MSYSFWLSRENTPTLIPETTPRPCAWPIRNLAHKLGSRSKFGFKNPLPFFDLLQPRFWSGVYTRLTWRTNSAIISVITMRTGRIPDVMAQLQ
jgi:hypothetical protein